MNQRNFRVGTFNLCNMALPDQVFYSRERYSQADYDRKLRWVAGQLDQMRADIVGFQEVFQSKALQQALQQSEHCRQFQLVSGEAIDETPAVALASRFPILEHQFITDFPPEAQLEIRGAEIPLTHFSRPVLRAKIQLSRAIECTVFVVHLKSKRPIVPQAADRHDPVELAKGQARSLILRAAEAIALRVLLMEVLRDRDYPVIVLGDLNDGSPAVTSQIISGEPPHRRLASESKRDIWDVLLYHAKDIQARQSYDDMHYTHLHNGHYESLDHIMVSQEFVAQNPNRLGRVVYVSVFNDHLLDETLSPETIPVWQSDHGQVVASIELGEARAQRSVSMRTRTEITPDKMVKESVVQIEER
ncbi:MAG: endonuclease/exonuclease/phosphatase family protein [Elainella sp.]